MENKPFMKDICLCIIKSTGEVHSVNINRGDGKYYSFDHGGCINLNNKLDIFRYEELRWQELCELMSEVTCDLKIPISRFLIEAQNLEERKYKGFNLRKTKRSGVGWSDEHAWLQCIFDNFETAIFFIDNKDNLTDNFYSVISDMQKEALAENDGLVTMDKVKKYIELNKR
jgi:hypothetical protein